jgi:hypothetical protein
MSQHLHVFLADDQRQHLNSLITKGNAPARVQNRARILLLADRSSGGGGHQRTQAQVAETTRCCALTVGQVCRRFAREGLEAALSERPRPGKAPKITGDVEARLVTLACSDPPKGQARWTLKLLAEKLVELELVDAISEVAIYKRLKKRAEAVEGEVLVHQPSVGTLRGQDGRRAGGVRPPLRSAASRDLLGREEQGVARPDP